MKKTFQHFLKLVKEQIDINSFEPGIEFEFVVSATVKTTKGDFHVQPQIAYTVNNVDENDATVTATDDNGNMLVFDVDSIFDKVKFIEVEATVESASYSDLEDLAKCIFKKYSLDDSVKVQINDLLLNDLSEDPNDIAEKITTISKLVKDSEANVKILFDEYNYVCEKKLITKTAKPKKNKMHDVLGIAADKEIKNIYKSGKKLAKDLVDKVGKKKATNMLAFAANINKDQDIFDNALKSISSIEEGAFTDNNEGVDLFEDDENIPYNVQQILDKYEQSFMDGDYEGLKKAHDELYEIGYTFDFYLDGVAYDLRKIGQKGKVEISDDSHLNENIKPKLFPYSKTENNRPTYSVNEPLSQDYSDLINFAMTLSFEEFLTKFEEFKSYYNLNLNTPTKSTYIDQLNDLASEYDGEESTPESIETRWNQFVANDDDDDDMVPPSLTEMVTTNIEFKALLENKNAGGVYKIVNSREPKPVDKSAKVKVSVMNQASAIKTLAALGLDAKNSENMDDEIEISIKSKEDKVKIKEWLKKNGYGEKDGYNDAGLKGMFPKLFEASTKY